MRVRGTIWTSAMALFAVVTCVHACRHCPQPDIPLAVSCSTHRIANVRLFGALGDGHADDTAAIQDAVDSLSCVGAPSRCRSGGTLVFPPGTYRITTAVHADIDGVCFSGRASDRPRIVLDPKTRLKMAIFVQERSALSGIASRVTRGIHIENLDFISRGGPVDGTSQAVLQLNKCSGCSIRSVSVRWDSTVADKPKDADGIALAVGTKDTVLRDVLVEGQGKTGIWVAWADNIRLIDIETRENEASGLALGRVSDVTVTNLHSHHNGSIGLRVGSVGTPEDAIRGAARDVMVRNARIHDNGHYCKDVNCALEESKLRWCCRIPEKAGVTVASAIPQLVTNVSFRLLDVHHNNVHGIHFRDGKTLDLANSLVHDNELTGVRLGSLSTAPSSVRLWHVDIYNNNNRGCSNNYGAVAMNGVTNVTIRGGSIYDTRAAPKQLRGIHVVAGTTDIQNLKLLDVTIETTGVVTDSYDLREIVKTGHYRISHPGSPVGELAAPEGSLYRDTTTGCRYVKASGWGKPGWQPPGCTPP